MLACAISSEDFSGTGVRPPESLRALCGFAQSDRDIRTLAPAAPPFTSSRVAQVLWGGMLRRKARALL